jgi:NAD(P)-dependent dehydrogenase (short-subunit alcohol dehydrogenase family)
MATTAPIFPDLAGKVALVTGGTSGIGRHTALALADAGAHVVITGRREKEGQAVAAEIARRGVESLFVQGEITDEKQVADAVAQAKALTGTLSFAFNNAGVELANVPTTEATSEQYHKVMDVNVLGVLLSMKHQLRAVAGNAGGGSIVNNASIAGSIAMGGVGIYAASKHAVLGLTKAAALEVSKSGVRINAVSPGGIDTEMLDRFTGGRQQAALDWMTSMHPIGRVGKPEEIAKAVMFLFSSASSFVTGHDLKVDGGFTAQ